MKRQKLRKTVEQKYREKVIPTKKNQKQRNTKGQKKVGKTERQKRQKDKKDRMTIKNLATS